MYDAMDFIMQSGGIVEEATLPYASAQVISIYLFKVVFIILHFFL
jgi:hypothetical protein